MVRYVYHMTKLTLQAILSAIFTGLEYFCMDKTLNRHLFTLADEYAKRCLKH